MDIETIEAGSNFNTVIKSALSVCNVVLVLIGPHWLTEESTTGLRRLDDENDYVRFEIETALKARVLTIPILLGEDTKMPRQDDLPLPLRQLTMLNAYPISDRRWKHDTDKLLAALYPVVTPKWNWKPIANVSLIIALIAGYLTEPLDKEFGLAALAVSLTALSLAVWYYYDCRHRSLRGQAIALVEVAVSIVLVLSSLGYYGR
jgi:hypothetical protein